MRQRHRLPGISTRSKTPQIQPIEREKIFCGVPQISAALGMSEARVRGLLARGALPVTRIGKLIMTNESALRHFVASLGAEQER